MSDSSSDGDSLFVPSSEEEDPVATAMVAACAAGDVAAVRRLVADGADVNGLVEVELMDDSTALMVPMALAAYNGHADLVRALAELGGAVEPPDDGLTPMYMAVRAGRMDMMRLLVTELGVPIDGPADMPPVVVACMYNQLPLLRHLMDEWHVDVPRVHDTKDLLHDAAYQGYCDLARYLLAECGIAVDWRDLNGATPLHMAACEGRLDVMRLLVDEWGADVNAVTYDHDTPLIYAAHYGELEPARYLVERGADVRRGQPLQAACRSGRVDMLRWLLDFGLLPTDPQALIMVAAITENSGDVLRELVGRLGCSPNFTLAGGYNPLYEAASCSLDNVVALIELGADDRAPPARRTLLEQAVHYRCLDVVRYLVEERGHEATIAVFRTACRQTEGFAEWLIDSGRADWRAAPACALARRLQQQHRRLRTEGLGSPLPTHLRRLIVTLLAAGRARLPPLLLRWLADALVRRVGRDVHAHPLSGSAERVCRGCGRRAPCRTCATCSFGLCADCAVGL